MYDWPELEWLHNPEAEPARDGINSFLDSHPGMFLGWYPDHPNQTAVIVFDLSVTDPANLVLQFQQQVTAPFKVVFRPGCYPLADLEGIWERAVELWRPYQDTVVIQGGIDPALGRQIIMLTHDAPQELVEAIRAEFGDLISLEYGEGPLSRLADGSPHYGGAWIKGDGTLGACTSGFAVDKDGGRWMVTAAHCNNLHKLNLRWESGNNLYYGITKVHNMEADAELIGSSVETYARIIHVDPCCPSTRLVTAKGDGLVGASVCTSGATTRALCGFEVTHYQSWPICYSGYCYRQSRAVRPDGKLTEQGDSGGPVYQRNGTDTAKINGMITAHGGGVVFQQVSVVESAVGANVATTCCTDTSW
ncbi:MAG: hypothetical protein ACRDVM_06235 [Acidimicrobiia bacterium]